MTHTDDDERGEVERYNDEHIAPKLLALAKECEAHGIHFAAQTSWLRPDGQMDSQSTVLGATKKSAAYAITSAAAVCAGNLDKMLMMLLRWHDDGDTDISRTMLGHWMKRNAPASVSIEDQRGENE